MPLGWRDAYPHPRLPPARFVGLRRRHHRLDRGRCRHLPVKVVSAGVDAATTSQSEADEKRGRELRKADEKRARDERKRCKPYRERDEPCPAA